MNTDLRKAEMTDKELLELAAKAAGISLKIYHEVLNQWNPLTDDGDALRLAVKLCLDVETHGANAMHPYICAFDCERNIAEEVQPDDGDPYSATRRAIVRAAAEIGKEMK